TTGRALRYAESSARGLLHQELGHSLPPDCRSNYSSQMNVNNPSSTSIKDVAGQSSSFFW
ncbi:MAG: hypothetical protein Q4P24_13480, partial [Rhodobacterales bacterium]|nr:hypothetical protein [Rhodobacterales bacterium]